MKVLKHFLITAILLTAFVLSFTMSGCSGSTQLPKEVCDVGAVVCDVSGYICTNVPEVPSEICDLINLACLNLNILCKAEPGTDEYNKALTSLKNIDASLNLAFNKMKHYGLKEQKQK